MINADVCSFLKIPIKFKNYCYIYPPSIKDTLELNNFNKYFSIFTISQEDIEDELFKADDMVSIQQGDIPTPYQYLLAICSNEEYLSIIQEGFEFFTKQKLTFLPEKQLFLLGDIETIILNMKDINDLPILKEEDYFDFQNALRTTMGQEELKPYDYSIHPKKRRMKAKSRYRDKIKAKQNQSKNNLKNTLASICCMGIGLNPLNIGEMSYAAIPILTGKYQMKEKYEIDIKSLLAGASSKKIKPKYWMSEND